MKIAHLAKSTIPCVHLKMGLVSGFLPLYELGQYWLLSSPSFQLLFTIKKDQNQIKLIHMVLSWRSIGRKVMLKVDLILMELACFGVSLPTGYLGTC